MSVCVCVCVCAADLHLNPGQQSVGLQGQDVGAVRVHQDPPEEVCHDVGGRVVPGLQKVRQQLKGSLGVVLLNGAVH